MVLQFFQHPLTIDALLGRVVENVHLPKGEEELTDDRIAHDGVIIAPQIRSRYSITWQDALGTTTSLQSSAESGRVYCTRVNREYWNDCVLPHGVRCAHGTASTKWNSSPNSAANDSGE